MGEKESRFADELFNEETAVASAIWISDFSTVLLKNVPNQLVADWPVS